MQLRSKIGVIGIGVVGGAIADSYDQVAINHTVRYDIDSNKCAGTWDDMLACAGIFVCVPSPTGADGQCDTSILEEVLHKLKDYTGVIISKVTAPPTVYTRIGKQYPNLVYVPEFLTEANALQDYQRSKFMIIGGAIRAYQYEASRVIRLIFPTELEVHFASLEEASLAKYSINSFLAAKVVFMNELMMLASSLQIDFNKVAQLATLDSRIGNSHCQVPGPDGNFGFSGSCFPKDTEALLSLAKECSTELSLLAAAVKKNTYLRLK